MRKILLLPVLIFIICACSKETEPARIETEPITTKASVESLDVVEQVNAYYDDLKTMICNSEALEDIANLPESYEDYIEGGDVFVNPLAVQMYYTKFEDYDSGDSLNFYSLTAPQRRVVLDAILNFEREDLIEKLKAFPELTDEIKCETEAMDYVIDKYAINRETVPAFDIAEEETSGSSISLTIPTGYGLMGGNDEDTPVDDGILPEPEVLIDEYYDKYNEIVSEKASSGYSSYYNVSPNKVRSEWAQKANRGDFVLALPSNSCSWIYINASNPWIVGHAGIINENITNNTSFKSKSTIECWTNDGVCRKDIDTWTHKHYIMGLQYVKHKIKFTWHGIKIQTIKTPVSNPEALADKAELYMGRPYVRWYEFLTSKWAAPSRFTCTSLVWWCAKKAYGISMTSWLTPLVSPSGIYRSSHTYIKRYVK